TKACVHLCVRVQVRRTAMIQSDEAGQGRLHGNDSVRWAFVSAHDLMAEEPIGYVIRGRNGRATREISGVSEERNLLRCREIGGDKTLSPRGDHTPHESPEE